MIQGLLGREWQEVKGELEKMGLPYTYQIARPRGKMEAWGSCRVIRLRKIDNCVEVALAYEKFSPRQHNPPYS